MRKKGFSLIELLVVISLIALVFSFGFSNLQMFLKKLQFESYIDDFANIFNSARIESLNHNSYVTICSLDENKTCKSVLDSNITSFINPNLQNSLIAKNYILNSLERNKQIIIKSKNNQLHFLKDAKAKDATSIYFCPQNTKDQKLAKKIVLSSSGRMRISLKNINCG